MWPWGGLLTAQTALISNIIISNWSAHQHTSDQDPVSSNKTTSLCLFTCLRLRLSYQLCTTWRERGSVGNPGEFPVCGVSSVLPTHQQPGCLSCEGLCVRSMVDPVCVWHVYTLIIYSYMWVCVCVFLWRFLTSSSAFHLVLGSFSPTVKCMYIMLDKGEQKQSFQLQLLTQKENKTWKRHL